MEDDKHLERAAALASAAVVDRFRALMEGREDGADPLSALVSAARQPRVRVGETLASYRLVRELGSGGGGVVFLAERADGQFVKSVAVKVLHGIASEDGKRRLRAERQILADLDHPNIARLLDGGETADGQPYLVLEYVEGDALHDGVAELGLAPRVALFCDIARAVAHAHQRLVVHRDLKPSNIVLTRDGSPRLLDFGVARLMADATDDESTRVFTVGYASPEQQTGGKITTRTDVFALGVILGELVAPLRPDADLVDIARKASAEAADDRYATVDALLDDLERWRTGMPVQARRPSLFYRAGRFVRRNRVRVALSALAIVAGMMFLAGIARERSRAQQAEAAAVIAKSTAERDAERTKRLLEFIAQAFDAASPDNAAGKTMSARELLADAEAKLDATPEYTGDRQAILLLLADLATRLGETERAARLATKAESLSR